MGVSLNRKWHAYSQVMIILLFFFFLNTALHALNTFRGKAGSSQPDNFHENVSHPCENASSRLAHSHQTPADYSPIHMHIYVSGRGAYWRDNSPVVIITRVLPYLLYYVHPDCPMQVHTSWANLDSFHPG